MNRRDFIKTVCGALATVVSGWAGWGRVQAASPVTVAPDAADAMWGMAVPFAVAGEGRFMLVDDDGTSLHVYLPQVRT